MESFLGDARPEFLKAWVALSISGKFIKIDQPVFPGNQSVQDLEEKGILFFEYQSGSTRLVRLLLPQFLLYKLLCVHPTMMPPTAIGELGTPFSRSQWAELESYLWGSKFHAASLLGKKFVSFGELFGGWMSDTLRTLQVYFIFFIVVLYLLFLIVVSNNRFRTKLR